MSHESLTLLNILHAFIIFPIIRLCTKVENPRGHDVGMMIKTMFETLCFAAKMTDRRKYLHQSRFAAIRAMLWSKAWNL